MNILVSACLMGEQVRYDGRSKYSKAVVQFLAKPGIQVFTGCPEIAGGLPTPRPPAEQQGARVISAKGTDATNAYYEGSKRVIEKISARAPLHAALLKSKSPSCGVFSVYDGSFSGTLVKGQGVAARMLTERGVVCMDETQVERQMRRTPSVEHPVALILGTGLSHVADLVVPVRRIPYADIDGFPEHVHPLSGHTYEVTVGTIDGVPVVLYPGRVHLYQGASAAEVTACVRHAHHLGCQTVIFACASAAVGSQPEGLGVFTDQLNLTGQNPLIDTQVRRHLDTPFVSMEGAYNPFLRALAEAAAAEAHIDLAAGVLAGQVGPTFETAAEVRMLETLGAQYVSMSTVLEVIMARALDMDVLGLTVATHKAGAQHMSHESIMQTIQGTYQASFEQILRRVLSLL